MTVAVEDTMCSTRIIENYKGEMIDEATFSSPVRIFGFDKMPRVGAEFKSFKNKKDAIEYIQKLPLSSGTPLIKGEKLVVIKIIPIFLKADVSGSLEAIEKK